MIKDRTKDLFLLDFSSWPNSPEFSSKTTPTPYLDPVSVSIQPTSASPVQSTSLKSPSIEPSKSCEVMKDKGNQDVIQPLQLYSRKKIPVSQSIQVQSPIRVVVQVPEIVPIPTKNVTPSTEPNKSIDECEEPSDMDLPIALWKGTRACTKHLVTLLLTYPKLSQTIEPS